MPFSHGSGSASGNGVRPDPQKPVSKDAEAGSAVPYLIPQPEYLPRHAARPADAGACVPRLAPGVEQLGEYQGSGLTETTYLVRSPGGQIVQLSPLLHLVLSGIDGSRTINEIAARATAAFGRTVSAGNVEYLLAHKLAALGLLAVGAGTDHAATAGRQDSAILALKLHRTLIPEAGVQHIARLFRPMFNPVVVVAVLACLIASDAWMVRSGRLGSALLYVLLYPLVLLLVLGLVLVSALFHECGHAAACRYGGARPGVIGTGFFVIWPAFFTNVTDTYRLGRAGRIRTDLGGVYFNAIFVLALTAAYLATGYSPLIVAILLIHLEIVQQLLPSLRFDGYFILADMVGVPDLFQRIGPTLRSMIPGRPADPRVKGLKRRARVVITAWVLLVVPLLGLELTFIVLDGPSLVRTFARSLDAQIHNLLAQFGQIDVAAGLVSVISIVLLALPMAGICYILLLTGRRAVRSAVAATRRRPALRYPFAAVVLFVAAALALYWGLLPVGRGATSPSRSAATSSRHPPRPAPGRSVQPARPAAPAAVVLTPLSAWSDENDSLAGYAIDGNPATAWQTYYYFGNPVFGGLKTGSGLIVDMGRQVWLSSVTITFGPALGADVSIEVGNDDSLAASALSTFTTVAAARGVGGTHTFECSSTARGRYVLIWLTKLPPAGSGLFHAQIFNIVARGGGNGT